VRPPLSVRVGQADYRIRIRARRDPLGECDTRKQRVDVTAAQSEPSLRDTVVHELLHAIWYESSANAMLATDEDEQEKVVRLLSPWLLMLLRDNPDLVAYLTS
jgi:hypothetical protein